MNKMDNDDLAALFEEMDPELKDQLLSSMEAEESEAVQRFDELSRLKQREEL